MFNSDKCECNASCYHECMCDWVVKKEWQGLSDDEIDRIYCEVSDNCVKYFPSELYAAWFKALKEKNNG